MTEILDYNSQEKPFKLFRPWPMVIEGLPILICLVGILSSNSLLITVGFCTLAIVYTFLWWYLFKTNKFTPWDIIVGIILGNGLSVILLGMLFYIQNWEGADLMSITSHTTLIVCIGIGILFAAIKLIVVKKRNEELRMSLKILSRIILLLIIFYALNMNTFMEDLLNQTPS